MAVGEGGVFGGGDELLGAGEVSRVLGVGEVTVWRWCREGSLPCLKIGRRWRVRRSALEEFVRKSERSETLVGKLRPFIGVPDNLLAIVQDKELMLRLDAAFFRVAESRGGVLVKYQHEDERLPSIGEVRKWLEGSGLDVARLEEAGRMRLLQASGELGGRMEEVELLVDEEREGGRSVWVNFDWDLRMGVEEALEQQRALAGFVESSEVVLKTTILEEDLDGWPGSLQRRAQVTHSGTMWLSEAGLALSRVTPPPAL
jgi:excisionase family DNA binding protein